MLARNAALEEELTVEMAEFTTMRERMVEVRIGTRLSTRS